MKLRTNIPLIAIRGEDEFQIATGIPPTKFAEMRNEGLPFYSDGKCIIVFPSDVKAFIRKKMKISNPSVNNDDAIERLISEINNYIKLAEDDIKKLKEKVYNLENRKKKKTA